MTHKECWYWICSIKTMNARKMKYLLEYFQTPEEICTASVEQISKAIYMEPKEKIVWHHAKNKMSEIIEDYHKLQSLGIQFVTQEEESYPRRLYSCFDSPAGIFVKGQVPDDNRPSVAIIGARACSNYGKEMALSIGETMASHGIQVVSGMAMGVDGWAHRGALRGSGDTYGILGCGVDICYPMDNYDIYKEIPKKGGLISEYAPKTPARGINFPMRNRIISALADCIVVVEAREKSGTLITVDQALEQGKEVMTLPGRFDDPLSKGCNQLIKNGAGIITEIEDVLRFFNISYKKYEQRGKKLKKVLAKEEEIIYSCLRLQAKHIETILEETGMPVSQAMSILLQLELEGYISQPQKNYYAIKGDCV